MKAEVRSGSHGTHRVSQRVALHCIQLLRRKRRRARRKTRKRKWAKPCRNLQVGDALLRDDEVLRMKWPVAIDTEANPGEDGLVRWVHVLVGTQTLDKGGHPTKKLSEFWRPVQKLILILEYSPST